MLQHARELYRTVMRMPAHVVPPVSQGSSKRQEVVATMLSRDAALVRRIRVTYGRPDDEFQRHLLVSIEALAGWLHLLPGLPGSGFERPGGAFEQALSNCLYCLQAAEGRTFDESDTQAHPVDTARWWRLACALAGLFVSLRQWLARIEVVRDDGARWPSAAIPLLHWLESSPTPRYRHRWGAPRSEDPWPTVYVASRCIDPAVMSLLAHGNGRIIAAMLGSIAGADKSAQDVVSEVVNRVTVAVALRDALPAGVPSPALLTRTLKQLLATSDWRPNAPGGHVWFASDGLFLLWPEAGIKLIEAIPRSLRGTEGLSSPQDLLRQLVSQDIVSTSPSTLLAIRLPGQAKPQCAVRITDAEKLLDGSSVQALQLDEPLCQPVSCARTPSTGTPDDGKPHEHHEWQGTLFDAPCPDAEHAHQRIAETHEVECEAQSAATAPTLMTLDTSSITNPRSRELVDAVVAKLNDAFDTMLARVQDGGVFVALTEFVGEYGDGASIVRALHDARLLAVDKGAPDRRVQIQRIEGTDMPGIVLAAQALDGYSDWLARWQDDGPG